ncbi:MAG TPA: hypothetical protein V6D30_09470 [Leptolyngbyaceae cyanobacterium]
MKYNYHKLRLFFKRSEEQQRNALALLEKQGTSGGRWVGGVKPCYLMGFPPTTLMKDPQQLFTGGKLSLETLLIISPLQ